MKVKKTACGEALLVPV